MKKLMIVGLLLIIQNVVSAQKNFIDQPYVEVTASADSLVVPDRILMSIRLSEADTKNRISVEEQERKLLNVLKKFNINPQKDLQLLDAVSNYRSTFLSGNQVIKTKVYELKVETAKMAGSILSNLEAEGIAGSRITKASFSKMDELIASLRAKAVLKSKKIAENLAKPLGQKIGKAIHLTDNHYEYAYDTAETRPMVAMSLKVAGSAEESPIDVDFEKLKFSVQVNAKYILE